MNVTIYGKSNCPNCSAAKALLEAKGLEYAYVDLDGVFLQQFQKDHPDARQMPQIFIDGQRVGGLAGLQAALKQLGL